MIVERLTPEQTKVVNELAREIHRPLMRCARHFMSGCEAIGIREEAAACGFSSAILFKLVQIVALSVNTPSEVVTGAVADRISTEMQILMVKRVNELNGRPCEREATDASN
jgi:hypothetical protein